MKRVLCIILSLVLTFSLTACGGSGDSGATPPADTSSDNSGSDNTNTEVVEEDAGADTEGEAVEITFATWSMENEMQKMVELYNAAQDRVHVTLQVTPLSEYGTLMNNVLGTAEGPDVLWAGLQTRLWGNAGMLAELQDQVAADSMDLSVFLEYPLKQNYVGDKLYGLPCYTDSYAICYNKAVFDKYGVDYPQENWSWTDYENIAEELNSKIKAEGGSEFASALSINEPAHGTLLLLTCNGAKLYNEDVTGCALNSPESVEMLEMVQRMVASGAQADYDTLVETSAVSLFISGLAGMIIVCPDPGANGLFEGTSVKETLDYIAFPNGPTSGTNYLSTVTMNNIVINSGTDKFDAAWDFVKWYTTDQEAVNAFAEIEWHLPTNINAVEAWISAHDYAEVYAQEADKVVTVWDVPLCNYSCLGQISPNLIPVFSGEISAEEGLANLETAINELIAEEQSN